MPPRIGIMPGGEAPGFAPGRGTAGLFGWLVTNGLKHLKAQAVPGFARVEVALEVNRDRVQEIELAGIMAHPQEHAWIVPSVSGCKFRGRKQGSGPET